MLSIDTATCKKNRTEQSRFPFVYVRHYHIPMKKKKNHSRLVLPRPSSHPRTPETTSKKLNRPLAKDKGKKKNMCAAGSVGPGLYCIQGRRSSSIVSPSRNPHSPKKMKQGGISRNPIILRQYMLECLSTDRCVLFFDEKPRGKKRKCKRKKRQEGKKGGSPPGRQAFSPVAERAVAQAARYPYLVAMQP